MKFFILEPEVAGEIGENTIYDKKDKISHLHFIFTGWYGFLYYR